MILALEATSIVGRNTATPMTMNPVKIRAAQGVFRFCEILEKRKVV